MPVITVVKPFLFRPAEGEPTRYYEPGEYEVDDATADHWFVRAHLEGYVQPEPAQGTFGYAQAKLNAEQAVRRTDLPAMTSTQPRAPISPEAIKVASRSSMIPEGAHYFAGGPQEDKPMPGAEDQPRVSFIANQPQH
jgi:hypothetical protein